MNILIEREKQKQFIREFLEAIMENKIFPLIDSGKIPSDFDGLELKILVAELVKVTFANISRQKRRVNKILSEL